MTQPIDFYPDNNPKTLSGLTKVPLNLVPPSAKHFLAEAFADGAAKYGPYNWREKNVSASIYYAAAQRHMDAWWDGEDVSLDAGVHHIAHAMACMAIILDALTVGALNDDRPAPGASPDLQQEYAELSKKEQPTNDRTDAPTGFNPPTEGGILLGPQFVYSTPGTTSPSLTRTFNPVEPSGVPDVQEDVRPVAFDPSFLEGSAFVYGSPDGYEYWKLSDGRVVRYDNPHYRGHG